jgi:1,2-phenylacetyl-CoA epoxidase catalytic subunit
MNARQVLLPERFHKAVEKWRDQFIPDYALLLDNWERHFPKDPRFQLCAYRELGICNEIECGDRKGQPKAVQPGELPAEAAGHLLGAIKAQASTEFGSIQQHQLTLARAQDEQDQFWVLRMMAEELRHGYQMIHLLLDEDWSAATDLDGAEMVEEILSMTTGSHVLGAFNIDFDSFVDNAAFCCIIDRVGKYQLDMQKISAYRPYAESMPPMLREEAFHLAAGVVPLRRWMEQAGKGAIFVTSTDIQKAFNKWVPRGLEMFGDERGGATNVRYGLKPMANAEAQALYYEELGKVVRDLNMRYLRARLPELSLGEAEAMLDELLSERATVRGVAWEDLLHLPAMGFFRRRGVPAFQMIGWGGEPEADFAAYRTHLRKHLPDAYRANRDFGSYLETLQRVAAGELTIEQASRQMPALRRVGGTCPCSRSVRWVVDEPVTNGHGEAGTSAA